MSTEGVSLSRQEFGLNCSDSRGFLYGGVKRGFEVPNENGYHFRKGDCSSDFLWLNFFSLRYNPIGKDRLGHKNSLF